MSPGIEKLRINSFKEALENERKPVFVYAPAIPKKRTDPGAVYKDSRELGRLLRDKDLDAVVGYEISEEAHWGGRIFRPEMVLYPNIDSGQFVNDINSIAGHSTIVSVGAAYKTEEQFKLYLEERLKSGIKNYVLVGGETRERKYPLTIPRANEIAKSMLPKDGTVGNIFLAIRDNEPERMLRKTEAEADYFFGQVTFTGYEGYTAAKYVELCEKNGIKPRRVFQSYTIPQDQYSVDVLKHLGAHVPERIEEVVQTSDRKTLIEYLNQNAVNSWRQTKERIYEAGMNLPLGIIFEELAKSNRANTLGLVDNLSAERRVSLELDTVVGSY